MKDTSTLRQIELTMKVIDLQIIYNISWNIVIFWLKFVVIHISWLKHSHLISGANEFYGSVSSEKFLPGERQRTVLVIAINDDVPEVCIHWKQN